MGGIAHKVLWFDRFSLDMARGSLRAGAQDIGLRPKVYEVLRHLVENAGRLVPKQELHAAVWQNVFVGDDSLAHCIRELREKLGDVDHRLIKTISRRGYMLDTPISAVEPMAERQAQRASARVSRRSLSAQLPLPDRPSIAVLPFVNLSDDPDQEFFADGIVEDVITELSRFRSLFVIARSSTFTYKDRVVDIAKVARELGVRYVVEGSVRKANNRVRITAQLIEAASGNYLWADRFDGSLDDIFDLQDQITEHIVVAVEPEIQAHERERARRKQPESLDAWEILQRGLSHLYRINKTDRIEAIRLLRKAVALDPDFATPHAYLAHALWPSRSLVLDHPEDTEKAVASALASANQALSLDPNEPMAHFALGRLHGYSGETEMAISEMKTAIVINPNFDRGHHGLGWAYYYCAGQAERALPHLDASVRLSPRSPLRWLPLMIKGSALSILGRHNEAVACCRLACQLPDTGFLPYMRLAAALAETGQKSEAQAAVERAIQLQPALSLSILRSQFKRMHKMSLKSLLDSLRKAGLPE